MRAIHCAERGRISSRGSGRWPSHAATHETFHKGSLCLQDEFDGVGLLLTLKIIMDDKS